MNRTVSLLSKLTIIIPTYNRHEYALRNIRFWSGKDATVHILDGSPLAIPAEKLNGVGNNIHYHYLPESIYARFKRAVEIAETEYTVFHGDDEFFSPSALTKCIAELEKDKELVACMGRCMVFDYDAGRIKSRPNYGEMKDYAILHNDPADRMLAHMSPYTCSTIYSVLRTPVWKTAFGSFTEQQFTVFSIEEYQVEMIVSFMGKSKVIPALYWFRSIENERIQTDIIKFNIWWQTEGKQADKERFVDLLVDTLSTTSDLEKKSIRNAVLNTADTFATWCNTQGIGGFTRQLGFGGKLIEYIGARLSYRIMMAFKRLIGAHKTIDKTIKTIDKTMHPFREAVNQLQQDGVSVNEAEITEIENIVLEFHKTKQEKETINA